ncbi:hypothetical protein SKAU_G00049900 [Synaphobranchus kaupii]|uniref:Uncharacterized protein n=1 Tax=Synaphobranchus kaupii TaxID=118154 RepID=A0A9Q1G2Y6_SYNKA|nr:hypothetical protein SKAU_G00049900 [Synaphobranchus kaupii]
MMAAVLLSTGVHIKTARDRMIDRQNAQWTASLSSCQNSSLQTDAGQEEALQSQQAPTTRPHTEVQTSIKRALAAFGSAGLHKNLKTSTKAANPRPPYISDTGTPYRCHIKMPPVAEDRSHQPELLAMDTNIIHLKLRWQNIISAGRQLRRIRLGRSDGGDLAAVQTSRHGCQGDSAHWPRSGQDLLISAEHAAKPTGRAARHHRTRPVTPPANDLGQRRQRSQASKLVRARLTLSALSRAQPPVGQAKPRGMERSLCTLP